MESLNFLIRPLEKRDAGVVQDVALASWRHTYQNIFPDSFIVQFIQQNYAPERTESLVAMLDSGRHHFVVAEVDSKVVGFCHLAKTDEGIQLLRVYIRPSHMRLGIGRAFLQEADQYVRFHNYPYYFCYVHSQNEIGKAFYLKNNFVRQRQKDVGDEQYLKKWVLDN
ncbi:MAG: GNAT family N-acetyltransferase [Chloroflexota bacterium]